MTKQFSPKGRNKNKFREVYLEIVTIVGAALIFHNKLPVNTSRKTGSTEKMGEKKKNEIIE